MGLFDRFRKKMENKQNDTKMVAHICAHCKKEIREGGVFAAGSNLFCESCSFHITGCSKLSDNSFKSVNICKAKEDLHIFWDTNCKNVISQQQYQKMLDSFCRFYNKEYLIESKSPIWTETEDLLMLSDSWQYYAYHDGTLRESFKISIRQDNTIEPKWDSRKDWPCEKQQVLFNTICGTDARKGWVDYSMHTALLLLNPFNLSGVWRLDIELSRYRFFD